MSNYQQPLFNTGYTHTHNITPSVTYPSPYGTGAIGNLDHIQVVMDTPIVGLDELCEALGVPSEIEGFYLRGQSGRPYPLIKVIMAQLELMTRLNILLVHRKLVPDE